MRKKWKMAPLENILILMAVAKAAMRSWTKSGSRVLASTDFPIKLCKLTFSTICLIFLLVHCQISENDQTFKNRALLLEMSSHSSLPFLGIFGAKLRNKRSDTLVILENKSKEFEAPKKTIFIPSRLLDENMFKHICWWVTESVSLSPSWPT